MSIFKTGLQLAGGLYLGKLALGWLGNAAANRVKFTPGTAQVDWSAAGSGMMRIRWNVGLENRTGVTITVNSLDGQVFFGDIKLADVSIPKPTTLFSGQQQTVQFIIEVPMIQAIGDLVASIISNGVGTFFNKIRFKGVIRTSAVNVPLDMFIPVA